MVDDTPMKRCSGCGCKHPVTDFPLDRRSKDGYGRYCLTHKAKIYANKKERAEARKETKGVSIKKVQDAAKVGALIEALPCNNFDLGKAWQSMTGCEDAEKAYHNAKQFLVRMDTASLEKALDHMAKDKDMVNMFMLFFMKYQIEAHTGNTLLSEKNNALALWGKFLNVFNPKAEITIKSNAENAAKKQAIEDIFNRIGKERVVDEEETEG